MKQTHEAVNYRAGKGQRRCGNCTMFVPPGACTAVKSPIRPQDVCKLFELKSSLRRSR